MNAFQSVNDVADVSARGRGMVEAPMNILLTGATGLVGEGVLLECLESPHVERVLSVSRRPSGRTHPKLTEVIVADFKHPTALEGQLGDVDACFYCAGISSAGMSEADYTDVTFDTPLRFATFLVERRPQLVFCHLSGAHADSSEAGRMMWARVKGRAENALVKLPFKAVANFRPGLMKPTAGQRNVKGAFHVVGPLYPLLRLVFPGLTMTEVARSMINTVRFGAPKPVLEAVDMRALALARA